MPKYLLDTNACVGLRNREAMVRAVRYLLDLGHRRMAMIAGVTHQSAKKMRSMGD